MNNIEELAIFTYTQNLDYLQKNHLETFQKIDTINKALEHGLYSEKYALEYKEEYFDVIDTKTKNYFYNSNSIEHAKEIVDSISLKKDENTIEAFYNLNFEDNSAEVLDDLPLENNRMGALASLIDYTNKNSDKNALMKTIPKFIFPGCGLGIHIPLAVKKHDSKFIWILEDDLELFRLSLFTTNYKELAQSCTIRFSIQENETQLRKDFDHYLLEGFSNNNYLKYTLLTDTYLKKIELIQSFIVSQQYLFYPYYKMLARDIFAPKYIAEGYNILNFTHKNLEKNFFKKPILVVAAGPSLDKNIEWLKKNQHNFIIVSIMASIKTLSKHNIKPHIVTHVDATTQSMKFLDDESYAFLDKTLMLFSTYTIDPLVQLFSKEQLFFFEQGVNYKHNNKVIFAPSVGETAYAIGLLLNAKEVYLLGLDLALDQETGMTHAKDHFRSKKSIEKTNKNVFSLHENEILVKGNFQESVRSLSVLKPSIDKFSVLTKEFKKDLQNIYNLSSGAYLEGAVPIKTDAIVFLSNTQETFEEEIQKLKNLLISVSTNKPSMEDKLIIQSRIKTANKLKLYLQAYKSLDITNAQDFTESFAILIPKITLQEEHFDDTRAIFTFYIRYVIGYISAFFNTQNIENQDIHAKNISDILIKQLLKIINTYIDGLSEHQKKY